MICRRFEGLAFNVLQPPPLLECRLREALAFIYTGVDSAGPVVFRICFLSLTRFRWPYSPAMSPELFIWIPFHINPPSHSSNDETFVARRGLLRCFIYGKTLQHQNTRMLCLKMDQCKNTLELPANSIWRKHRCNYTLYRES